MFVAEVKEQEARHGPAWWFAFVGERLLVREDGEEVSVPLLGSAAELGLPVTAVHYLGRLDGTACYAVDLADAAEVPEGMSAQGLRGLYGRLDEELFAVAGRAAQIVTWERTHRFCGRCGTPTQPVEGERAKRCPQCGHFAYPRLSPCVIMLVTRGRQLLLARGRHFPAGFFGVVAGFVEPGESLEEAVAREVQEEVGVSVSDITYFGSQPWPYPHQLMIGFTARWAGGEILVDPEELAEAHWFTAETLPSLPPPMSIARRLVDAFVTGRQ